MWQALYLLASKIFLNKSYSKNSHQEKNLLHYFMDVNIFLPIINNSFDMSNANNANNDCWLKMKSFS